MTNSEKQDYVDILEGLNNLDPRFSKRDDLSRLTQLAMFMDGFNAKVNLDLYLDDNPDAINETDTLGRAALHWIVGENYELGVETLLDRHGDIDIPTLKEGFTPLMISCSEKGSAKLTKMLLERKADYTVRTKTSATAFHIAVASGNRNSMRVLILYGADPFLALQDGRSALELAPNEKMKTLVYSCIRSALLHREKKEECCAECEDKEVSLLRCGNCYAQFYCSRECQIEHWRTEHGLNCPGSVTAIIINDPKKSRPHAKSTSSKLSRKTFVIRMYPVDGDVFVESEEKGIRAKIIDKDKKMFIKQQSASFHWAKLADNSKKEILVYFSKPLTIPASK